MMMMMMMIRMMIAAAVADRRVYGTYTHSQTHAAAAETSARAALISYNMRFVLSHKRAQSLNYIYGERPAERSSC
jgi:ribosomal protein S18 acetylase RimI-like enzyme